MSSPAASTDSGDILLKSRKIRIYPSHSQLLILNQWIGTARYTFNQAIAFLRQPDTKANWKAIKAPILNELPLWAGLTPYQVKSIAIRDACIAVSNAKRKFKRTKQFQQVRFKSRKRRTDSIYIPKSAISSKGVYHTMLGQLKSSEALPEVIRDGRLKHEYGKWFLVIPVPIATTISENQRDVVALDPGVRTFQTWYSPEGYGKVGQSDFGKIYRLCYHLDDLMARISTVSKQRKRRMMKASWKIRSKIRSLIAEIHHKTARFLCLNFKTVLIPTFETSKMVKKLRSKTARAMLTWSHFGFKTFLKHKASELGTTVVEVNEAYTSKTCGKCGQLNNIGSKPMLKCRCGLNIDRDLNGARNILLRFLTEALLDKTCASFAGVAISSDL